MEKNSCLTLEYFYSIHEIEENKIMME